MELSGDTFGRIDKLFVDRDETPPQTIAHKRAAIRVALVCGLEISGSTTLQAALLTAANVADRCFRGSVSVHFYGGADDARLLVPGPGTSLTGAIRACVPGAKFTAPIPPEAKTIVFGTRPEITNGLQVTFD